MEGADEGAAAGELVEAMELEVGGLVERGGAEEGADALGWLDEPPGSSGKTT